MRTKILFILCCMGASVYAMNDLPANISVGVTTNAELPNGNPARVNFHIPSMAEQTENQLKCVELMARTRAYDNESSARQRQLDLKTREIAAQETEARARVAKMTASTELIKQRTTRHRMLTAFGFGACVGASAWIGSKLATSARLGLREDIALTLIGCVIGFLPSYFYGKEYKTEINDHWLSTWGASVIITGVGLMATLG